MIPGNASYYEIWHNTPGIRNSIHHGVGRGASSELPLFESPFAYEQFRLYDVGPALDEEEVEVVHASHPLPALRDSPLVP